MSGVDKTLQRQLGVNPQIDMIENVIWFRWDKAEPLSAERINKAVVDGGLGIESFKVLGYFTFEKGSMKGAKGIDYAFEGMPLKEGQYAVEIYSYEEKGSRPKVHEVKPYFEPKVYNPDRK